MQNSELNIADIELINRFINYLEVALSDKKKLREALETRQPFKFDLREDEGKLKHDAFVTSLLSGQVCEDLSDETLTSKLSLYISTNNWKKAIKSGDRTRGELFGELDSISPLTLILDALVAEFMRIDKEPKQLEIQMRLLETQDQKRQADDNLLAAQKTKQSEAIILQCQAEVDRLDALQTSIAKELEALEDHYGRNTSLIKKMLGLIAHPHSNDVKKLPFINESLQTSLNKLKIKLSATNLNEINIKLTAANAITATINEFKSRKADKTTSSEEKAQLTETITKLEKERDNLLDLTSDKTLESVHVSCVTILSTHENKHYTEKGEKTPRWFTKARLTLLCTLGPLLQRLNKQRRRSTAEVSHETTSRLAKSAQALKKVKGLFPPPGSVGPSWKDVAEEMGKQYTQQPTTSFIPTLS